MKKFISIIAAAACAATIVSFAACGSDDEDDSSSSSTAIEESGSTGSSVEEDSSGSPAEEETPIPSDVVTAEEWVAAFDRANFANVTAERELSYDYSSLTNGVGSFTSVYYDPDQYRKETYKKSATSTTKIDAEYSEGKYGDVLNGFQSRDSEYSYEGVTDYNYTDVEVLKGALGDAYADYDWDSYSAYYADFYEEESLNKSYKDYIQFVAEEDAYFSDSYVAEQRTEDGIAGDWEYSDDYSLDISTVLSTRWYSYLDPLGAVSFDYGGGSDINFLAREEYYNGSEYDEESGAYVYTYYEDSDYDADIITSLTMCGYEWTLEGGATRTYYVKINDGHVSSIKLEYTYTCYFSWTNDVGTYYDNTESSSVAEYKFYDYGTTTVEVPAEIEASLTALKESN